MRLADEPDFSTEARAFKLQGSPLGRSARRADWLGLAGFLGLCLMAGLAALDVADVHARAWYLSLGRPAAAPPGWLIAPAAAALGLAQALAAWLVWRQPDNPARRRALSAWGGQLALGTLWTPLFFGLHLLLPALLAAVSLVAGLAWTAALFRPLDGRACLLLLPCLAWSGHAAYLCAGCWWLAPALPPGLIAR